MYKEGGLAESQPREEAGPEPSDLMIGPRLARTYEQRLLSGMWSKILEKRKAKAADERAENRDGNFREPWEEGFL